MKCKNKENRSAIKLFLNSQKQNHNNQTYTGRQKKRHLRTIKIPQKSCEKRTSHNCNAGKHCKQANCGASFFIRNQIRNPCFCNSFCSGCVNSVKCKEKPDE